VPDRLKRGNKRLREKKKREGVRENNKSKRVYVADGRRSPRFAKTENEGRLETYLRKREKLVLGQEGDKTYLEMVGGQGRQIRGHFIEVRSRHLF